MTSSPTQQAWSQVIALTNGLSLASTLIALAQRDSLASLPEARAGSAHPGPLAIARRALTSWGWLDSGWTRRARSAISRLGRADELASCWQDLLDGRPAALGPEARRAPLGDPGNALFCAPAVASRWPHLDARDPIWEALGWTDPRGDWTALGRQAVPLLPLLEYPLAYLPLLNRAEELLFGDPGQVSSEGEEHLDRERDVRFSGEVFSEALARPFLDLLQPLFARSDPPRVMVDIGCGDARMLAALAARLPLQGGLTLVAADRSAIARRVAEETLNQGRHPFRVLEADISEPGDLVHQLRRLGLPERRTVFVCKSVIHNRSYRPATPAEPPCPPHEAGGWITERGLPLSARQVAHDLERFFERWKPWLSPHGLVVAEPHLVEPSLAAACQGRSLQPCLEITHGYSRQLLVTVETYRAAADRAGLRRQGDTLLGAALQGHPSMSVSRFYLD